MAYKPTKKDFQSTSTYKPTAGDFLEEDQEPETTGVKGIIKDIGSSALSAIPSIIRGLTGLPSEIKGAAGQLGLGSNIIDKGLRPLIPAFKEDSKIIDANDPKDLTRVGQNIAGGFGELGHGLLSGLGNVRDYLVKKEVLPESSPSFRFPESWLPKEYNYAEALGRKGQRPGDALISSIPEMLAYGGAGELGTTSRLGRMGRRAAAGAAQGIADNTNPVESAAGFALTPEITKSLATIPLPGKSYKQFKENRYADIANRALDIAKKDAESRGTLTKKQAANNRLVNYTNIEGQQMPVDIGTLIGNQTLKDIYNVTSKVPFTGGKKIINNLVAQGFDKSEAQAMIKHAKQQNKITEERNDYQNRLLESLPQAEQFEKSSRISAEAPARLETLRHPNTPHNQLLKDEATKTFEQGKSETTRAYKPFHDLKEKGVDLNEMPMPDDFNSKYKQAFDEMKQQSEDLEELFADDKDLGNDVSREVKRAGEFFTEGEQPQKKAGTALAAGKEQPRPFKFKKATPEAITTHIRNLQSLASEAFAAGKHRESSQLNKMASALKSDMKTILRHNGHNEAVDALEAGDKAFQENELPFYNHKELKKLVTDKNHHLTDASRVSLSNALHQPNLRPVFNKLAREAKNATVYEIITNGKYGSRGHNMTPKEISSAYQGLRSNARQSLQQVAPETTQYLENLDEHVNQPRDTSNAQQRVDTARDKLRESEEKEAKNNQDLAEALKERYGKPITKVKSVTDAIKNISPLKAGGLGALAFSLHNLPSKLIAEGIGAAIPVSHAINKVFTDPELFQHFLNETKATPKKVKQNALETALRKAFKESGKATTIPETKRKPMELELTEYNKR